MSTYSNGRRAPNVSQYIANLNTIPTPQELAAQNDFDLASDGLDFLNTEFFDFDASAFDPSGDFSQSQPPTAQQPQQAVAPVTADNFQYAEFQNYPQAQFSPASMTQSPSSIPFLKASAVVGDKRNATTAQLQPLGELEDSSRQAAEEDKRRRNTAASARFRVKKKQREAALEKQTREMNDKIQALETKVQQLETENKWLKGLITEKSGGQAMDEKVQEIINEKQVDSRVDGRNDGVGTEAGVEA